MSSTPRAEQFEDRLKTIIHSVLAGDSDHREAAAAKGNQDVKPPLHVLPYNSGSPPHSASSSKPMFSPVKKELPTHLPLPPSGIVGTDGSGCPATSMSRPQQIYYTTNSGQPTGQHGAPSQSQLVAPSRHLHPSSNPTLSHYQQPIGIGVRPPSGGEIGGLTSRTASDVISSEIEKSIGPNVPSLRNREVEYPPYSPHINREESPANHGPPKVAHSSSLSTRIPPSLTPGSSVPPPLSSRGGAPSMARMSQGKVLDVIKTRLKRILILVT